MEKSRVTISVNGQKQIKRRGPFARRSRSLAVVVDGMDEVFWNDNEP